MRMALIDEGSFDDGLGRVPRKSRTIENNKLKDATRKLFEYFLAINQASDVGFYNARNFLLKFGLC